MSVVREENPNEVRERKPVTAWQLMGEGLGRVVVKMRRLVLYGEDGVL